MAYRRVASNSLEVRPGVNRRSDRAVLQGPAGVGSVTANETSRDPLSSSFTIATT